MAANGLAAQFRDVVAQCAVAMAARGARVDTMLVDCAAVSWDVLAGLLEDALAGESLAGVVSFLGLSDAPPPDGPAGLAGTLALVEALGDAGITVPLWVVTREAAAEDHGHCGPVSGRTDPPAGFGARAATLLCTVLPGWEADQAATRPAGRRRVRRRARPATGLAGARMASAGLVSAGPVSGGGPGVFPGRG